MHLLQIFSMRTSQSSQTNNVPLLAISILLAHSVLLPLTARALAMWVFIYIFFKNSLLTVHKRKLAATTQTTPMVTSFHCSISVVQSVCYPLLAYESDQNMCIIWYTFFKSIFLKFPNLTVTILTLTNELTFQYICLTLQVDIGSPLVVQESDGIFTLVGIVSFGAAAGCTLGFPVCFARVTSFLIWISLNTGIIID